MERYDVVIVGGGSAGLAALMRLSSLGRQAILLEAGSKVGSKNISGGILYSKKPKSGQVFNVEDVYGDSFLSEAPFERKIIRYILHATSKNKIYSMDLTAVHEYETNFGYSVLMNPLNSWFAKMASENAQRQGGGIVPGVHVRSIDWDPASGKTIVTTDELEEFEVRAVIAADGVNSEIAHLCGARPKFSPQQLYQGVKVVVKLPEDIINYRFDLESGEGAAHLFAGDITLGHLGGGFLYTNTKTLSLGAVYHFDSLLSDPTAPHQLIDALIQNPTVSEFIKDRLPRPWSPPKDLPPEEQIRSRFAVAKLIKNWYNLRDEYLSPSSREELIRSGKYSSSEEMKEKLDSLEERLAQYGVVFADNYEEAEYGAKLIPDGKRCRMAKPYFRNVLFVGDAAGRGVFFGPKIEGLNVGIDDAVRAANAVAGAIERNNFDPTYLGESYSWSVMDSPYTKEMTVIDKEYVKLFFEAARDVPSDIIGSRYGPFVKLMSSDSMRTIAVKFANMLGYDRLLPMVESKDTYVQVPIDLAERLGVVLNSSYRPDIPTVAQRVARLDYSDDGVSHIDVIDGKTSFIKKMVVLCPTSCYTMEGDGAVLSHEGCVECGTCSQETDWRHPRGEKGVHYRYG